MADLSYWDKFLIAIAPESTGEAHVRENFQREQWGVATNWGDFPEDATTPRIFTDPVGPLDKFLIAIAPESAGEALVRNVYENGGNFDDYPYDEDFDWTTPDIIYTAGEKVKSLVNTAKTAAGSAFDYLKYAIYGFVALVILYFGLKLFLSRGR